MILIYLNDDDKGDPIKNGNHVLPLIELVQTTWIDINKNNTSMNLP